jgi:nucleoid DNA-binding protein
MAAKQSKKTPNLTYALKADEENGEPLAPEKDMTPALASYLAERANLTAEQATQFLNALAETAVEQLREHPNEYFILPGLGALVFQYTPPTTKVNPFTQKSALMPARGRAKFHVFPDVVAQLMPK